MTHLVFVDYNETIFVDFVTDLKPVYDTVNKIYNFENVGVFTVLGVNQRSFAEEQLGLNFIQNVYSLHDFIAIADTLDLKLTANYDEHYCRTTVRDFTGIYYFNGLGIDNI